MQSVPLPPAPAPVPVQQELWRIAGGHYPLVRLAGISGAVAVGLGVYGRFLLTISDDDAKMERKDIFNSTNRSHFLHTLVLLTTPLMRRPLLVRRELHPREIEGKGKFPRK